MKKKIITHLITFIIGGLIFGSIGVAFAITYKASDIVYSPSDTSWNVNTVGEAINSLALSKTATNYSTEEQVIGTWVDRKPLYQRSFEVTNTLTVYVNDSNWYSVNGFTNIYTETVAPTIDKLVYISTLNNGVADDKNSVEANTFFRINKNNGKLHSVDSPNFHWLGFQLASGSVITIQYTKTTDTAVN